MGHWTPTGIEPMDYDDDDDDFHYSTAWLLFNPLSCDLLVFLSDREVWAAAIIGQVPNMIMSSDKCYKFCIGFLSKNALSVAGKIKHRVVSLVQLAMPTWPCPSLCQPVLGHGVCCSRSAERGFCWSFLLVQQLWKIMHSQWFWMVSVCSYSCFSDGYLRTGLFVQAEVRSDFE